MVNPNLTFVESMHPASAKTLSFVGSDVVSSPIIPLLPGSILAVHTSDLLPGGGNPPSWILKPHAFALYLDPPNPSFDGKTLYSDQAIPVTMLDPMMVGTQPTDIKTNAE